MRGCIERKVNKTLTAIFENLGNNPVVIFYANVPLANQYCQATASDEINKETTVDTNRNHENGVLRKSANCFL